MDAQIIGGIAQGIGMAIFEQFRYDDAGQLLTTSFMDYLIPTAADIPHVELGHIETLIAAICSWHKGMRRRRNDRSARGDS